jgi:hypothetical protein
MSDIDNISHQESAASYLESRVESLERSLQVLLFLCIMVAGSVTIFVWRQDRMVNAQLKETLAVAASPEFTQQAAAFRSSMTTFLGNLDAYARTHPDVVPVLKKHNFVPPAPAATAPAAAAPARPRPAAPAAPAAAPRK